MYGTSASLVGAVEGAEGNVGVHKGGGFFFSYLEGVDWMGLYRGLEVAGWRMNE